MDEQGYRFGVGVLVVASLVIAIILVLFFGAAPNFFAQRYEVTIRFDQAPGIATDTPVRKNGVQIGRVKSFKLLEENGVDLTLELDDEHKIRAGEQPIIDVGSLITGDAVVEFRSQTPESLLARFDGASGSPANGMLDENEMLLASTIIKDGDWFDGGRVAPDPLDALFNMQQSIGETLSTIEQAGTQLGQAGTQVAALAQDVRQILNNGDGEIQRLAGQVELTIKNFNQTLAAIEGTFNDPNLKLAMETIATRLPELVDETTGAVAQAKATLAAFEGAGNDAGQMMKNLAGLTKPLAENGDKIVGDALRTLNEFNGLVGDIRQVAGRLNNSQGTIGKLIDDPQLYYDLSNTLRNISTVTQRLQPIVEDLRVFSDKVARQPSSVVDIRGAITGRPSGSGVKN
jgi:phospholipid/cholesterol/gamma-HCH transport system substrate-binding protein